MFNRKPETPLQMQNRIRASISHDYYCRICGTILKRVY